MSTVSKVSAGNLRSGPGMIDVGGSPAGVAGATTVAILVISVLAIWNGGDTQRILLTFSLAIILYATMIHVPAIGLPLIVTYLSGLGAAKRYLIPFVGYTSLDPLILVQPVIIGVFFLNLAIRRQIPKDTLLSRLIGIFLIIMALEVANPLQGGIAIGLSGALFYIVPLLWFYGGRIIGTKSLAMSVCKTVIFISVLSAGYGLWQQFVGLSDVEKQWVVLTKSDAGQYLTNEVMRVFSIFSAFAEYVAFIGCGAVLCFAGILRKNRLFIIPFIFLIATVLLSSSRGGLLSTLFACSVLWAVQGRQMKAWIPRMAVAAVLGVALLVVGLTQAKEAEIEDDTASVLIKYQAQGILEANDAKHSTGSSHSNLIWTGVFKGFTNPLGTGLGSTTLAAGKFGGAGYSGELDFSNFFVSCGAIGGLLHLFIVLYVIWRTAVLWNRTHDLLWLYMLGVEVTWFGTWLTSGRYSCCTVVWFLIGFMDKFDFLTTPPKKKLNQSKTDDAADTSVTTDRLISSLSVDTTQSAKG